MENESIVKLFQPAEGNISGLMYREGKIFTVSSKSQCVFIYEENDSKGYVLKEQIPIRIANPGGITSDGDKILIIDKKEKVIYKLDQKAKKSETFLCLTTLKANNAEAVLNSRNSTVSDIEFKENKIWFTCMAGYSSAVYNFDYETKQLFFKFFTRGPEPKGICLGKEDGSIYVLDSSNKQLSRFKYNGEWNGLGVSVPYLRPIGLAIDNNGNFIVSNEIDENSMKRKE